VLLVTDERGTPEPERSVARVTVTTDAGLLPVVADFVRRVAHRLGLRNRAAEHLDLAVQTVCRNVIGHAFEADEEGRYDVEVLRRPGRVVIAVEDRGLPFDYAPLRADGDTALPEMLHHSFADEVHFINLGREGNRVELIKHLPRADAREVLPEEEHNRVVAAPAAPEDAPLEIRMMRPEESAELSRCVYRSYGYSYDWDYVYYPDRIRELQEGGLMRSCVAVTPEGEFVGHLAAKVEHPDSPVAEAGQAVVDPRFRGHRLFERMKTFLAERAREWGMYGLYSEATAVHPYSQRGNLKLGAKETGFLLGYIPASVSYKEIGEDRVGRRGSVALFYMRTRDEPERTVYPPDEYREAVQCVVEHNGLNRAVEDSPDAKAPPSTRMNVSVRRDHNLAFMQVQEPGADLRELVQARLRGLCLHGVDCVYADLPLSRLATSRAGTGLADLGFFFGGIIPEADGGGTGGDVLRLQYLNEVEVRAEDVHTASDFGKGLVDFIFQQKRTVER
jgi:anti-sigma regulatory factor (Ser/Thr protein kinase)/GNAT superfamily N-acetyltransferase